MLIGISGKQQVGKTTMANVAVDHYGFRKIAFADALRTDLMAELDTMGIPFSRMGLYVDKTMKLDMHHDELPESFKCDTFYRMCDFDPIHHIYTTTYRRLLQWYGISKREINPDYWVQRFLDIYDRSIPTIVDDVRMINEAVIIQVLGGMLVRVNRPMPKRINSQHVSEIELDNFPGFNCTINKSANMALAEYIELCHKHLSLWTGALDDEGRRKSNSPTRAATSAIPNRE